MKRLLTLAVLALAILLLQAPAIQAQDVKTADQDFAIKATTCCLKEVQLGKLAQERAANADVKKFAEDMVREHTQTNKQLTTLVQDRKINIPKEDRATQEAVEKLSKLRGAEFDREYMKIMVDSHKEAVALFEKQAKDGKDEQLKAFASKTLPTLRDHLKHAQQIFDKVGKGQ